MIRRSHLLLLLTGLLFIALNLQIPLVIDDYVYSRSFVGVTNYNEDPSREAGIHSLGELLSSQQAHYVALNGRLPVHTLVQVCCAWLGQIPFDLLQGVMLVLLIIYIGRAIEESEHCPYTTFHTTRHTVLTGSLACLVFLLFYREPNCLYHGVAYGINYLWTAVGCLAFRHHLLSPTHNTYRRHTTSNWARTAGLCLLGLLAGWSNEALALPFSAALLWEGYCHARYFSRTERVALVAYFVGVVLLVISPSNWARWQMDQAQSTDTAGALPYHLLPLLHLRLTALYLLALLYYSMRGRLTHIQLRGTGFWHIVLLGSVLMSLTIGGESIRQVFAAELSAALLLVKLLHNVLDKHRVHWVQRAAAVGLLLFLLLLNAWQYPASQRYQDAVERIAQSPSDTVMLPAPPPSSLPQLEKFRCCEQSAFQLDKWAWYYGKHIIVQADNTPPRPDRTMHP